MKLSWEKRQFENKTKKDRVKYHLDININFKKWHEIPLKWLMKEI